MPKTNTKKKSRGSQLQSASTINLRKLPPIPDEARHNPINWATEHTKSLVPEAAKNVEYAIKFGDDKTRLALSLEVMAMHGLSSKGPQQNSVVPAIQLILPQGGIPWNAPEPKQIAPSTVDGEVVTKEKMK